MTASNDETPRSEPAVEVLAEVAAPNEETKDGMEPVKVEIVVLNPDEEIIDVPEEDHPAAVNAYISADDGTDVEAEDTQIKEETLNAAEPDAEDKADSAGQDTVDKTNSSVLDGKTISTEEDKTNSPEPDGKTISTEEDKTNSSEPDDKTISTEEDKTNTAEPDDKTISTEEDMANSVKPDSKGKTNPTVTEDKKISVEAAQEGTDVKTDATLPFTESDVIQQNVSDAGPDADADEKTEAEENINAATVTEDKSMAAKDADDTNIVAVGSSTDVEGDSAPVAVAEVVDTAAECAAEESTAEDVADTQAVAAASAVEDEVPAPISVVEAGHSRAEAMAEVAPPAGAGPPMGVAEMKRMAAEEDEGPYESVDVIGDLVDKENQELARRRREQEARCPAPDVIKADM